jgi:D-tyrosyl-tRNA(Tyr) deacylase
LTLRRVNSNRRHRFGSKRIGNNCYKFLSLLTLILSFYPDLITCVFSPLKVLVQRVSQASVTVDGETIGQIDQGLLLLVGFGPGDDEQALRFCAEKCANLRIFADDEGKMNRSLLDIGGGVLCISQFTLYGDCRKGRRPSFTAAAPPEKAEALYEHFLAILAAQGLKPERGVFGAYMQIEIHNDGPVTLMVESPQ